MAAITARRAAYRAARTRRPNALALLLGQYLTGQIEEDRWQSISEALDAIDGPSPMRDALAAFCLDASVQGEEIAPVSSMELQQLSHIAAA